MSRGEAGRSGRLPFLRAPPFPHARFEPIAQPGSTRIESAQLLEQLRRERVGGRFWGSKPKLPEGRTVVLAPDEPAQLRAMLHEEVHDDVVVLAPLPFGLDRGLVRIDPECDLWCIAEQATRIRAGANQELALVAAIAGTEVETVGTGPYANAAEDPEASVTSALAFWRYVCPYGQGDIPIERAIALLGEWRRLMDGNQGIAAVLGVARWKRARLDALLWDGAAPVRHASSLPHHLAPHDRVLAWKSRASSRELSLAEARGLAVGELEDGFIRSSGLGANCVPPLSAIVDWRGVYFDPAQASDLEHILEEADIGRPLLERAAALRERIVRGAISKYAQGGMRKLRPIDSRRRVLVAGQVEDDRSIISGGGSISNGDLIKQARALEPDAWIIYKPHPDVEAGHRKGYLSESDILEHADEIERDMAIAPLLDTVDSVHVITSLAGFEALMRHKIVTTHGVPFYAGWGLTRDLASVPNRRKRRRSLEELVAAALLLYPRYVDPVTGLPCTAEILVGRFETNRIEVKSLLITARKWQGWLQQTMRRTWAIA